MKQIMRKEHKVHTCISGSVRSTVSKELQTISVIRSDVNKQPNEREEGYSNSQRGSFELENHSQDLGSLDMGSLDYEDLGNEKDLQKDVIWDSQTAGRHW